MGKSLYDIAIEYVNHRAFALDNKIAMSDMNKLKAITYIKNHIAYVKHSTDQHQKNMIKHLLNDMEVVLPGESSKYYECMCKKLNEIKSRING